MRIYFDETLKKFVAEEDTQHGDVQVTMTGLGDTHEEAMNDCLEKLQEAREKAGE